MPGKNQIADTLVKGAFFLPTIGIDEKTIAVKAGDAILQAGKDYQYNLVANRVQFINPAVLRSDEPIEITYETMRFRHQR
jgi:cell surface protein SprA